MAAQSKTVCLRAFNKDLDGTNPWERQGPMPPPLPKRIAWPGGKIVSNKDEALANFLRRKVDQGQTLTPEQMTMLKRMAYPNTSASVPPGGFGGGTTAAAARGKRKVRGVGHVYENSGGGGGGSVYARNLLHKLERKVAGAPDPFEAASGNGGVGGNFQMLTGTSKRGMAGSARSIFLSRRKVDLSSLKSGGTTAGSVSPGGGGGGTAGGRRIVADGLGGFTIATGAAAATAAVPTTVSSGGTPLFDLSGEGPEMASPPEQEQQRGWTNNNKRLRVVGGGGRLGAAPVLPAAAAAAAADIPALYREAGACSIAGKKKKGSGGKGGTGVASGKKGSSQNVKQAVRVNAKGGGMTKAVSIGGGGGERSLDELMSGGLAATRR